MFWLCQNAGPIHAIAFMGDFLRIFLMGMKAVIKMTSSIKDDKNKSRVNKGGRPRKQHKRRLLLAAMCTPLEKKLIEINAQRVGLTVSEFLRNLGLKNRIQVRIKSLPKSVLELKGTLNHTAANINQLARRRNSGDELNALERAMLNQCVREIQGLVNTINSYLQ
jgi:Mg2+ and Co2+ transporter CorA